MVRTSVGRRAAPFVHVHVYSSTHTAQHHDCPRCRRLLPHRQGSARYENGCVYRGEFQHDHRLGWGEQAWPNGDRYEGEWTDDKITGGGERQRECSASQRGQGGKPPGCCGWLLRIASHADLHADPAQARAGSRMLMGRTMRANGWTASACRGAGCPPTAAPSTAAGGGMGCATARACCSRRVVWLRSEHAAGTLASIHLRAVCDAGKRCSCLGISCQAAPSLLCVLQRGGYKYMGAFERDQQHGQGRCLYADGSEYEGEWREGSRCARATTRHSLCHDVVAHLFKQCVWVRAHARHGAGKLTHGGSWYQGHWQNDRQHGVGTQLLEGGERYVGELLVTMTQQGSVRRAAAARAAARAAAGP